jgi:cytochrome c
MVEVRISQEHEIRPVQAFAAPPLTPDSTRSSNMRSGRRPFIGIRRNTCLDRGGPLERVAWMLLALTMPSFTFAGDADIPELLVSRRCNACHVMTETLIGPPYQAIAARHSARAGVMEEVLARKIILGGGGNWGVVPMVPNEHVTPEEARAMARWILQLEAGEE